MPKSIQGSRCEVIIGYRKENGGQSKVRGTHRTGVYRIWWRGVLGKPEATKALGSYPGRVSFLEARKRGEPA